MSAFGAKADMRRTPRMFAFDPSEHSSMAPISSSELRRNPNKATQNALIEINAGEGCIAFHDARGEEVPNGY